RFQFASGHRSARRSEGQSRQAPGVVMCGAPASLSWPKVALQPRFRDKGDRSMASSWRNVPFFRWSFLRLLFGMKHLTTEWQVGDGREARLAEYVVARAKRGDVQDAIRTI